MDQSSKYKNDRTIGLENQTAAIKTIPTKTLHKEDNFAARIKSAKISPIKKLERIYEFMSELYGYVSNYTPCGKGCSSCCHYNVTVSELEIAYIERNTNHKRMKQIIPKRDFHGEPCPFLKNNKCSIYEFRPFVCRRHHALTPDNYWCHPDNCNEYEFSFIQFSGVEDAFKYVRIDGVCDDLKDIRQIFADVKQ